ncbi:MAG: hypothetical protein WC417_03175 [Candidatus Omnitrophota bacterium]|jgi:hypothetical protein
MNSYKIFFTPIASILVFKDKVIKKYLKEQVPCGILGGLKIEIDWEIRMQRAFKSRHSFPLEKLSGNSYVMPRFLISLGSDKCVYRKNLNKVLSFIGIEDLFLQLDEIVDDLKKCGLSHYDLHPGNLFFSEKEKLLKLGDFFWCNRHGLPEKLGINMSYGNNDKEAARAVQDDIRDVVFEDNNSCPCCTRRLLSRKEKYIRDNFDLVKNDKEYLFNFYRVLGKDFLPVDKLKSRKYFLKALAIKPLSFQVIGKIVRV